MSGSSDGQSHFHQIHFAHSGPDHLPQNILNTRVGFHCFRDCLVFLLRGAIFLEGFGALVEPGYAYAIKDEEMLGLGGNTTIFVMEEGAMEEGAMKGICAQKTREKQEEFRRNKEANEKRQRRPWNRVRNKFRVSPGRRSNRSSVPLNEVPGQGIHCPIKRLVSL